MFLQPLDTGIPSLTEAWHNASYPAISPSNPALSVAGKTVFVTGGGVGIGFTTARAYAAAGASRIAISGRTEKTFLSAKGDIESAHKESESLPLLLRSLIRRLSTLPSLLLEKRMCWFTMQRTSLIWWQLSSLASKSGGPALKPMSKVLSLLPKRSSRWQPVMRPSLI